MTTWSQKYAKNLWEKAVLTIGPEERNLVNFQRNDRRVVLQQVLDLAETKKKECLRKRWRIKRRNGDAIILRDVFEKIITWVQKFKSVGDIAMQYDPGHASLPWAGFRLLLQCTINDSQIFGAMIAGLECVANLIVRYSIFEAIYLRYSATAATAQVEHSLLKLYAAVLMFLGKAHHYYDQNSAKRIANSLMRFTDASIDELMHDIRDSQNDVERDARLVDAENQHMISHSVNTVAVTAADIHQAVSRPSPGLVIMNPGDTKGVQQLLKILSDIDKPIHRMADQVADLHDGMKREQRFLILQWLSNIPYAQHHQNIRKDMLQNSGLWMLDKSEYKVWQITSSSSILWLHGIPGSGKSKLTSLVVDKHITDGQSNSQQIPLAYFYCSRDTAEPQRADPEEILRSIARQLSSIDVDLPIRGPAKLKYEEVRQKAFDPPKLSPEESKQLILSLTNDNPATIVVDGLDECDPDRRYQLIEALEEIVQQSANVVKLFLTSRDDGDIVSHLADSPNFYIHAHDNSDDINRFIDVEVKRAIEKKRLLGGQVSSHLRNHLAHSLRVGANGMFRWVTLQIQNLCDPRRMKIENDVFMELGRLPKSLADLYAVIIKQIHDSGPSSKDIGDKAIKWVLIARRPLGIDELIAAVSVKDDGNCTQVSKRDVLNMSCNLLVEDTAFDVFRFAHISVREYLETREDFTADETHVIAARRCLDVYLRPETISGSPRSSTLIQDRELGAYACYYWPVHCAALSSRKRWGCLGSRLEAFLFGDLDPDLSDQLYTSKFGPVNLVCLFGLVEMVRLFNDFHLSAVNELQQILRISSYSYMNGLHMAIYNGHLGTVEALLDKGVDITKSMLTGESPLHIAARRGNVDIIRLLIEKGADPNLTSLVRTHTQLDILDPASSLSPIIKPRTALGFRTGPGGLGSAMDEDAEAPLHYAAFTGRKACVMELLSMGADVDVRSPQGATPLHKALEGGYQDIIETLVGARADVNVPLQYGRTPLHFAAAMGQERAALHLLRNGADTRMRDLFGNTAHDVALRYSHSLIADALDPSHSSNDSPLPYSTPWLLRRSTEESQNSAEEAGIVLSQPPLDSNAAQNSVVPDLEVSEWNSLVSDSSNSVLKARTATKLGNLRQLATRISKRVTKP